LTTPESCSARKFIHAVILLLGSIATACAALSNISRSYWREAPTSLQLKLIKIGTRVVRHARAITFQLAEVAVTGPMVCAILAAIHRLRAPPSCA